MSKFIAIDCGTTTTRFYLVVEKVIIQTIVKPVGITKSIDNKILLKNTIKEGICQLLFENNICELIPMPVRKAEKIYLDCNIAQLKGRKSIVALDKQRNELWRKDVKIVDGKLEIAIEGKIFSYKIQ